MKKIILYIFVFVSSLGVGLYFSERPKSEGVTEKYIYENPEELLMENSNKAHMPEEGFININTATAHELTALPDIGAKMAERIVEYRRENGEFEVKEDLMRVSGIGDKTFEKIKDKIILK